MDVQIIDSNLTSFLRYGTVEAKIGDNYIVSFGFNRKKGEFKKDQLEFL